MWRIVTDSKRMAIISSGEFEQYFRDLYKPLCLFALRFTERLDDAEDIENLKSYMYQAVRNRSLSLVTQPVELQTTDQFPDMEDSSEEEQMYNAERDARLWNAIDGLPPERKKIFLLSKRDGLKYQEIAEELNISIKTVENQMGKALKALRETAVRIYNFLLGLA